jgi:hypothetical protein
MVFAARGRFVLFVGTLSVRLIKLIESTFLIVDNMQNDRCVWKIFERTVMTPSDDVFGSTWHYGAREWLHDCFDVLLWQGVDQCSKKMRPRLFP